MNAAGHSGQVGVNWMTDPLARVAVRRPNAMLRADHERWHYQGPVDVDALCVDCEGGPTCLTRPILRL